VRDHVLIAAVYHMTIDLEEKHKTDRSRVLTSGAIWLGDERREHPRTEVNEVACISTGGASTRCRVLNISAEGSAIVAFVPERFQSMTEKDRSVRKCRVVWVQQNRIGVAFES
jgi:PilZ domain